ncbi:hypothetical protein TCAL_07795 [Tigriopus californicus]|uniref:Sulfotransferase domain-containing protein n=1 Tax=Tigriopus californicus TaxID=6832 RepID=A0A553PTU9_TIGCA|nr:hypothetical protein TCAL_07795 [Tigriopus californicus]
MSKTRTIVRIVRKNAPFLAFSVIMFATLSLMQSPFKNSLEARNKPAEFEIVAQNSSSVSMKCNQHRTVTSTKLESRHPWSGDPKCARFKISHMIPHCRPAVALASYPGSGNTWVRYLLEGATGIFTGSRYKDLQIQMYGLWGEIRNWADGTTIVQKTHDANEAHVTKVLVLHYENVKSNPEREMRKVLNFLQIPADPSRLSCMQMHKNGFFVRGSGGSDESEVVPFHQKTRQVIDSLIDRVNAMLFRLGIQRRNEIRTKSSHTELPFVKDDVIDKSHGTKMVLKEYFKWLDTDQEGGQTQGDKSEDVKTALMKQLFRSLRSNSDQNTITGLSDKAEGLLTKAVEIWPILQKPFQRDPIQDAIETDAYRGETMEDVAGNFKYI